MSALPPGSASGAATPDTPARHSLLTLGLLSALMAFASISTDVYLPALPAMALALKAGHGAMELTISSYLIGFSLGQLVWGPISDRYGRRLPVALGLVLFIIGSAGCALSGSVATMIAWRILQALGACASVVLARAMVRDLYAGPHAARMMSTLMTVAAVAPLIGPAVGSLILQAASWRAIFWTLAGIGALTLLALRRLPETLPAERRNPHALDGALSIYVSLLGQRRILAYMGTGGFFYGGIYAYVAGSPAAYISYHHMSPQAYGVLFSLGIIGIMATNQISLRLVLKLGSDRLMRIGALAAAGSGLLLALTAGFDIGGVAGLALPLLLFVGANGFIVANAIAGALTGYGERAGAVSALVGAAHFGTGILGSALVGLLADGTPWPMGLIIAICGVGTAFSALSVPRKSPA
ncbi:multidrug effflux MFS transporter [Herbaspirillum sp. LeCh32-8]|uniref:multidrug effflux MFS transporter n=1 Tax=Herbaspirillum sp. LeCh32-8 TaxID=2821356 RepID=UPI001AE56609|nr:multidrug effflux MFS transporter [Herbaspirillum sp. LeCh32-8]MBP0597433.1 multidrug effflux MFS transporter [Herbaspirillum sp. LeCh32-8]